MGVACLAIGFGAGTTRADADAPAASAPEPSPQASPSPSASASPSPSPEAGRDSDLTAGEAFTWDNGLIIAVEGAQEVMELDEWDFTPEGHIPFRVTLTITNDGDEPVDLDEVGVLVSGATNGGEAASAYFEDGHEEIAGRLAPGVTETKNADWSLSPDHGRDIVVQVAHWNESVDFLAPDPEWLITIT
ncbi:hypothetical protein D7319_14350 [Streptomyces radicis]|uniref:DUF4352 domain-containing protein n=1 Tax=Streptomyces radicis TaxID=1750517 RepID=A0A3A9WQU9_9ACTN|nr:hypothetical protein D7319_14350 [Streptomyces radicis]RKN21735.1 hypothetical protein D7318_15305 [Streptomyces radicis]